MITDDPGLAARALLDGALVLLPTETVYGVAGRADDPRAVARIYATKGRPRDHPVIVHVATAAAALSDAPVAEGSWIRSAPDYARSLADAFWPGPMTLVLPRSARATDDVTGGQDTVAIRVPAHPVAHAVLSAMDALDPAGAPHGVAAPSANRFGRVSPTTVEHALDELADVLDAARDVAIDGGPCEVGVESTIIDCTGLIPRVLRPGGISVADIERATGLIALDAADSGIRVPGALPSHYAPRARVVLAADDSELRSCVDDAVGSGLAVADIAVLAPVSVATPAGAHRLAAPATPGDYARDLYAALRDADARGAMLVVAVVPEPDHEGLASAVADRLLRAAAPRVQS